jgi:acyl-CoA hydrolase
VPYFFEGGVITGEAKTLHRGKLVSSFVLGHHVVTEHGVASLSLRERAKALIAIAHPDFRDELTAAARQRKLL